MAEKCSKIKSVSSKPSSPKIKLKELGEIFAENRKMKNHAKLVFLVRAALIAALYVALTFVANALGIASGVIQVRLSEALTILPYFTPAAIPGLFVGCLLANWLTGAALWDVVFGSLATLIGAVGTYLLRKKKWLAPIPPIAANTITVPLILKYVYMLEGTIPFFMLTTGVGELLSCGVLGMVLLFALDKHKKILFG